MAGNVWFPVKEKTAAGGRIPKRKTFWEEEKLMREKDTKNKVSLGEKGIYDAKALGAPKVLLLGLQHMFAMFGSTILVPLLTEIGRESCRERV